MVLEYSAVDGVGALVLNRPDVLNAFNDELGFAVLEAVQKASSDDSVRCLTITGAGRGFCAGEDLGALADGYEDGSLPELGRTLVDRYNPLIRVLRSTPKPVVAAINGVAAGAGASLALACDYRIASEKAKFVLAFIKVGLVPDSGAVWFLAKMVGEARAMELATTGRPVDAAEALALGLVNEVVAADELSSRLSAVAQELAIAPTRAYALTKDLVYKASERSLDEQLEAEVDAQSDAGSTNDHLEGVKAFLGKRSPTFRGN
ncbi:MAG: 2-(1,2-epoxy,2-dihydrophenyl)acetyl-CoA isomerase [Actinomycetota bacterium]|jgi:2-(1,2-epoxy-1,2-dihydrophenyl)acetyl-CoA isomerase|nr:2-(1,2-epoxy,2-dihydrophenyl)acetyl-CoA isomerase [Actinomycetota bacterium]